MTMMAAKQGRLKRWAGMDMVVAQRFFSFAARLVEHGGWKDATITIVIC